MKKLLIYSGLAMLIMTTTQACKKNQLPLYEEGSGLTFDQTLDVPADSLNYTFALNVVPKTKDTVYIPLLLTGWPSDQERQFVLEVDPKSTAKAGVHYDFTPMKFPANKISHLYPIIVYKTENMDKQVYQLKIAIATNESFSKGAAGRYIKIDSYTFPVGATSYNSFKLNITSKMSMPATWTSDITYYFGAYSNAKLAFMIEVLGINDFRTVPYGGKFIYADILNMTQKLNDALNAFEDEYGYRKKDENNQEIIFR